MELIRDGPSYTVSTLRALHARGWTASQLFFILGADAFAEIATWREFPAVLSDAHFVVVARPGLSLDAAIARTPELRPRVRNLRDARDVTPDTGIFLVEARTRDVSSTVIRERVAAGQSIDDLVPAAVARHIIAHQLYGAVDHLHGEDQHN
jgi:nicotinate-nucleotide adenylyltransferase